MLALTLPDAHGDTHINQELEPGWPTWPDPASKTSRQENWRAGTPHTRASSSDNTLPDVAASRRQIIWDTNHGAW